MIVTIPLRLPSAANLREHWAKKARRVKAERQAVAMFLGSKPRPSFPVVVTLTRVAPRALDGDNLQSAFKAPRDQVAAWFGVADNHPGIRWRYAQERRGAKVYAVEIRMEEPA
jgi:hypothetical protein